MEGWEAEKTRTVSVPVIRYLVVNRSPLLGLAVNGWYQGRKLRRKVSVNVRKSNKITNKSRLTGKPEVKC